MDLGASVELDYEEECPPNDSNKSNCKSSECLDDDEEKSKTKDSTGSQDCLQLNCPEEEEYANCNEEKSSEEEEEEEDEEEEEEEGGRYLRVVSSETNNNSEASKQLSDENEGKCETGDTIKEKSNGNILPTEHTEWEFTEQNNKANNIINTGICNKYQRNVRKRWNRPFSRRPPIKRNTGMLQSFNHFRDFSHNRQVPGVDSYISPIFPIQSFTSYPTLAPAAFDTPQLGNNFNGTTLGDRFSSPTAAANGVCNSGYAQQWYNPFSNTIETGGYKMEESKAHTTRNWNNNRAVVFPGDGKYIKGGPTGHNLQSILKHSQREYPPNSDAPKSKRNFSFKNGSNVHFNKFGGKYHLQNRSFCPEDRRKTLAVFNSLKDEEKELLEMKKQARLKRFSHDGVIDRKRSGNLIPLEQQQNILKSETPKVKDEIPKWGTAVGEIVNGRVDCNSMLTTSALRKDQLLKKENPFGGSSGKPSFLWGAQVKKEESLDMAKFGESKWLKAERVEEDPEDDKRKVFKGLQIGGGRELCAINDTSPGIKIFRTVSKSLEELGFKKTEAAQKNGESPPYIFKALPFNEKNVKEEVRPHLTGCIVKVLNVPPTTTTNDVLAMSSHAGIVKEVKLNFPKENSVAIRFAEPTSAENFFNLYHGQKINNYFLNVIII